MVKKKRARKKRAKRKVVKKRIRKKKENFCMRNYRESWNYIKESKNFIWAIVGVFVLFALIGFFVPASPELEEAIMNFLKQLLEKTKDFDQWKMTQFLFLNNLQSSFFGLLLGVVLGIFPVLSSIVNGYVLGFVAAKTVEAKGIFVLWRLLPHGIFELPAVFISLGLGLKFGTFIFRKKKGKSFKDYLWNGLRVLIFIVIPLLVFAAIIEGALIFLFG